MFSSHQNCTVLGRGTIELCGFGEFCCMDGCCIDFTYFLLLLIVISMVVIVAVFIHVEVMKERRFNEKLKRHVETCNSGTTNVEFGWFGIVRNHDFVPEESRIFLGASPIDGCPFNLPPSCSPPMTVPRLKFHKNRPIRQFLNKHL